MFGPISYGISNGVANAAVGLAAADLVPPGDNGKKISGSELAQNISREFSKLRPSPAPATLNLPLGFTLRLRRAGRHYEFQRRQLGPPSLAPSRLNSARTTQPTSLTDSGR